jgi:20S proteasome subunit beta 6
MPIRAIARLIQTMLYSRRFFPYYVYNILGGIEDDGPEILLYIRPLLSSTTGTGAVYSFDPVGSYERLACRAAGAAQEMIQPFLDNQVRIGVNASHSFTPHFYRQISGLNIQTFR